MRRKEQPFGVYLRELRVRAGLTQLELAECAGVHHTYVCKIEAGHLVAGEPLLRAMAAALEVNADEFVMRAGRIPAGQYIRALRLLREKILTTDGHR